MGLHLSLSGCSDAASECGRAVGICGHPKTIRKFRKEMAHDNRPLGNTFIDTAASQKRIMLLTIDDFHSVHTIMRPTSSETSTAIHMATCIIDVPNEIESLPQPQSGNPVHYWPRNDACKGSINIGLLKEWVSKSVSENLHQTRMEALPAEFSQMTLTNVQKSLIHLRQDPC